MNDSFVPDDELHEEPEIVGGSEVVCVTVKKGKLIRRATRAHQVINPFTKELVSVPAKPAVYAGPMPSQASALERRLCRFLTKEGVDAKWGRDSVPKISNPLTLRWVTPDIFIPSTRLHVEVKGQMTVETVRQLVFLAREHPRYYLFQGTLRQWARVLIHEDVPTFLSASDVAVIRDYARAQRDRYLAKHPRRWTRSNEEKFSDADLAYSRAFQRQELLALARDEAAAKRAGELTAARIRCYVRRWLGDLDLF